eukprot:1029134-Rhodomonas_salina.1
MLPSRMMNASNCQPGQNNRVLHNPQQESWTTRMHLGRDSGCGLGGRKVGGVSDPEDVGVLGVLERVLVDVDEAVFVGERRLLHDFRRRHVRGHVQHVEGSLDELLPVGR